MYSLYLFRSVTATALYLHNSCRPRIRNIQADRRRRKNRGCSHICADTETQRSCTHPSLQGIKKAGLTLIGIKKTERVRLPSSSDWELSVRITSKSQTISETRRFKDALGVNVFEENNEYILYLSVSRHQLHIFNSLEGCFDSCLYVKGIVVHFGKNVNLNWMYQCQC